MDREKVIVRTSVTGIVTNILLVIFKAGVGILSNSIAVVLDAVNNLSLQTCYSIMHWVFYGTSLICNS